MTSASKQGADACPPQPGSLGGLLLTGTPTAVVTKPLNTDLAAVKMLFSIGKNENYVCDHEERT
jgi:hypothetical protein